MKTLKDEQISFFSRYSDVFSFIETYFIDKNHLYIYFFLSVFFLITCQTKENNTLFNLDFEYLEDQRPVGWVNFGDSLSSFLVDSMVVQNGKYSVLIEKYDDSTDYGYWRFPFYDIYDGKEITLSGYIKTENVTDGYAGLFMQIDPFNCIGDMRENKITGTTGWTKYEIALEMDPARTSRIMVGGVLTGKGKMWLDNLSISIDGKDIRELAPLELTMINKEKMYSAEKDTGFDKGADFVFPELHDQQINNLELLGKLWGFLKYHHPAITGGNYNWDYELFRILPDYLKSRNTKERDDILTRWLKKYGKVPSRKPIRETLAEAILKPDLSWVENSDMGNDLKETIYWIYKNRNQGEQYYLGKEIKGSPLFRNENAYSSMPYPDACFRLLALYRYWNVIHYFFPYKDLCDNEWENVLKDHIFRFISARDELEYEKSILLLIGEINDTHAQLWEGNDKIHEWRGYLIAPFRVQFVENKLVVTDYFNLEYKENVGPDIGDIITHIGGKSIESIVDSIKPYYPMSNESAGLRDISWDLLRSNRSYLDIRYLSSGQAREATINLYPYSKINLSAYDRRKYKIPCYRLIEGNIGYVTLASITYEDIPLIKKDLINTKGIIIDIRNYPNEDVIDQLGAWFVADIAPFVLTTTCNINNPGEFMTDGTIDIKKSGETYKGKVVILVNEETQSHAEFVSMALRAGRNSLIVGSQTAGADGDIALINLPGGLKTSFSSIGIYYPDGVETQRIGIIPDVVVKRTVKGIKKGKDEVLDKAVEILKK